MKSLEEIDTGKKESEVPQLVFMPGTEKFEAAIVHLFKWLAPINVLVEQHKEFRLVLEYKPEEDMTHAVVYVPKEQYESDTLEVFGLKQDCHQTP